MLRLDENGILCDQSFMVALQKKIDCLRTKLIFSFKILSDARVFFLTVTDDSLINVCFFDARIKMINKILTALSCSITVMTLTISSI